MFKSSEFEEKDFTKVVEDLMVDLIDDVSCGLCFEVHRACKLGTFLLDETDFESQRQFEIVDKAGLDVFGQVPTKKQYDCPCPNCSRSLAASRFAPHLEKCMGMGRISSRIASRRIASNTGKKTSDVETDENDDDSDLNYWPDRKAKKLRKEKTTVPSKKSSKLKSSEKRKKAMCGMVSDLTKNISSRHPKSMPCSDRQRNVSLKQFLQGQSSVQDDVRIDLDSYDQDGSQMNLWDSVSNASPADSFSTGNS